MNAPSSSPARPAADYSVKPSELAEVLTSLVEINQPVMCWGPPGIGKCLRVGTDVVMWDGTTKAVEDVAAGDSLMGPDGQPRHVLNTVSGR